MPAASPMDNSKNRMIIATLPNNPSSQILVKYASDSTYKELGPSSKGSSGPVFVSDGSSQDSDLFNPKKSTSSCVSRSQWTTVSILTFVNLINYMV